jgi:ribose 5-phosphate isomerase A
MSLIHEERLRTELPNHKKEKLEAARVAIGFVRDGEVVGLGSGSTASIVIRLLAERVRSGLRIRGVATSAHSERLARKMGIPLTTLDKIQQIDVTIDGADEVDPQFRLIKGGGGALLREKIVASASRKMVIVADSSKCVRALGRFPLPVEIIPFAAALVKKNIAALGATVRLRKNAKGKPYVTDEGHYILDCHFGRISNPSVLARKLEQMPGVVEHGLFIGYADVVVIGRGPKVEVHRRRQ